MIEIFDANVQLVIKELHCQHSQHWPASTCMSQNVYSKVHTQNANLKLAKCESSSLRIFTNLTTFLNR